MYTFICDQFGLLMTINILVFTLDAELASILSKQLSPKSQPELINFYSPTSPNPAPCNCNSPTFCAVILPVCAALPRRQVFALCAAINQTFSAGGLLMSHGAATSSSWGKLFMWLLTQLTLPDRWAKRVWVEALSHPGTNNVSRHTGAGEAAQCRYMTVQLARWCQSVPTAASPNNPVTANSKKKPKKQKQILYLIPWLHPHFVWPSVARRCCAMQTHTFTLGNSRWIRLLIHPIPRYNCTYTTVCGGNWALKSCQAWSLVRLHHNEVAQSCSTFLEEVQSIQAQKVCNV